MYQRGFENAELKLRGARRKVHGTNPLQQRCSEQPREGLCTGSPLSGEKKENTVLHEMNSAGCLFFTTTFMLVPPHKDTASQRSDRAICSAVPVISAETTSVRVTQTETTIATETHPPLGLHYAMSAEGQQHPALSRGRST